MRQANEDERRRFQNKLTNQELLRLADARDMRGLAALLAPSGQALPDPGRLYRGLALDDVGLDELLASVSVGRGVPSREAYSPAKLADFAMTETLRHGIECVRAIFKNKTPEVEAALCRFETALVEVKRLFRSEVALRLAAEADIEQRLLERCALGYFTGNIPPYLQSAVLGGADGIGAGWAALFSIEKGLKHGKHPVVVEFERPAAGFVNVGVWPDGANEFVILGDIPGPAIRAVWIEGRRFTPELWALRCAQ